MVTVIVIVMASDGKYDNADDADDSDDDNDDDNDNNDYFAYTWHRSRDDDKIL
jgi:hypothetical protein